MREIKFRVYDKESGLVGKVAGIDFDAREVEAELPVDKKPFLIARFDEIELMQFTGLTDKNGVEIYECDVVVVSGARCVVQWDERQLKFIGKGEYSSFWIAVQPKHIEVIGNIHANPELLEGAR